MSNEQSNKMNCQDFCHIIDNGIIPDEQLKLMNDHMESCTQCRNYYLLVYQSVENANEILGDNLPEPGLDAEIGQFVFNAPPLAKVIPMWVKLSTAAAAIVCGLLIGSIAYDARMQSEQSQEYSYLNTNADTEKDTLYMAETTENLYRSFIDENE